MSLEKGDRINFTVLADAMRAQQNSDVILRLKSSQDIIASEKSSGYSAMIVGNNGSEIANTALKTYVIESGKLTITKEPYSSGNLSYAPGAKSATLLSTRFTLTLPIETDGLFVRIDPKSQIIGTNGQVLSGASALNELKNQFRNFSLFVNEKRVASTNLIEGTSMVDAKLNFKDSFDIPAIANVRVVADIGSQAQTNTKVKLNLAGTDLKNPEYADTGKKLDGGSILGSVAGHFTTVEVSRLQVIRNDGYGEKSSVVMGSNNLQLMQFLMDNNNVGEVQVSQLKFKAIGNGNAKTPGMSIRLFADGLPIGKTKSVGTDSIVSFDSLSFLIPSGDPANISVVADTYTQSKSSLNEEISSPARAISNQSLTFEGATGLSKGDRIKITPRVATSSSGGLVNQSPVYGTIQSYRGATATVSGANFEAPENGSAGASKIKINNPTQVLPNESLRFVENANNQM